MRWFNDDDIAAIYFLKLYLTTSNFKAISVKNIFKRIADSKIAIDNWFFLSLLNLD